MSRRIFLLPGELHFGEGNLRLETVLGSCVAIVLRHRELAIGGMCHFLLPSRPHKPQAPLRSAPLDTRYGDDALVVLLQHLAHNEIPMKDCVASVYGGANVIDLGRTHRATVGESNVGFVLERLKAYEFDRGAIDLAGTHYRYLTFDLHHGTVHVRKGETQPALKSDNLHHAPPLHPKQPRHRPTG